MEQSHVTLVGDESQASIYRSCLEFRKRMEAGAVDLEEAMEFLLKMSLLLLARIRELLPASSSKDAEEEEVEKAGDLADAPVEPVSTTRRDRVEQMTRILEDLLEAASLMYARGLSEPGPAGIPGTGAGPEDLEKGGLAGPDPPEVSAEELARCWASLKARAIARTRTVAVSRLSFVVHLRRLWRAVLAAAKNGLTVKFSAFVATHPRWMRVMDFLALLELLRRGRIAARQDETLGEIEFTLNAGFAKATASRRDGTRFVRR